MFSYRHGFHAGNHGDVLKHLILCHLIDHFNQKDSPYWLVDMHAGAGIYDLAGQWAQKKMEYAQGIEAVWQASLTEASLPAAVGRYLEVIGLFNPDGALRFYPGSPWIALKLIRPQDRMKLFELHPIEADIIRQNLSAWRLHQPRQVTVLAEDAFAGIKKMLPPPTRRAMILADPSYEDKQDYRKVVETVKDAMKRFPTGCYAIWYPLVQRREALDLARQLQKAASGKDWIHASISTQHPAKDGIGLHGSGMVVINPPWQLFDQLKTALPWLVNVMGQDDRAGFKLEKSIA